MCAEREDLFCFSNALSTSEEREKCGFHDVPKCWGVNVCEPVCRDVCLCVCVCVFLRRWFDCTST